jgi:hypothetical protein
MTETAIGSTAAFTIVIPVDVMGTVAEQEPLLSQCYSMVLQEELEHVHTLSVTTTVEL